MWQSLKNICMGQRLNKSQSPANFNHWRRASHLLKKLGKTKAQGSFEGGVKQESQLDKQKSLLNFPLAPFKVM